MRHLGRNECDETGAALVLALVFSIAVALLLGALVSLSGTNLLNTTQAKNERTTEYNGDAAVEGAIQALRPQAPTGTCPTFTSGTTMVYCSMGIPAGYYGRVVQFWACPTGTTLSNCQTTSGIVQAEVAYNDVKSLAVNPLCTTGAIPGCYGSSWGTTLTVVNWVIARANS